MKSTPACFKEVTFDVLPLRPFWSKEQRRNQILNGGFRLDVATTYYVS
jgi:hypothetical protein